MWAKALESQKVSGIITGFPQVLKVFSFSSGPVLLLRAYTQFFSHWSSRPGVAPPAVRQGAVAHRAGPAHFPAARGGWTHEPTGTEARPACVGLSCQAACPPALRAWPCPATSTSCPPGCWRRPVPQHGHVERMGPMQFGEWSFQGPHQASSPRVWPWSVMSRALSAAFLGPGLLCLPFAAGAALSLLVI